MTLNIAMIATGGIADKQLAPALTVAPNAQLWSVLSRDKARAAEFADKHGAASPAAAHDDLDALLADPDLHAVLIASPDKLHADQSIRAARAGKHILTEKPMATDREGAAAMIDAADRAGVRLAVAYHMRWHMGHRKLFEAARQGAFGALRHMRVQWPTPARNADGWRAKSDVGRWWALAGVGTHCLDQIRWFMSPQCGEITRAESIINREVYKGPARRDRGVDVPVRKWIDRRALRVGPLWWPSYRGDLWLRGLCDLHRYPGTAWRRQDRDP